MSNNKEPYIIHIPDAPRLGINEGLALAHSHFPHKHVQEIADNFVPIYILIPEDMPKTHPNSAVFAIEQAFYIGLLEKLLIYTRDTYYTGIKVAMARQKIRAVPNSTAFNIEDINEALKNAFNTEPYAYFQDNINHQIFIGIAHKDGTYTIPSQDVHSIKFPDNKHLNDMFNFWYSEYQNALHSMFITNLNACKGELEDRLESETKQQATLKAQIPSYIAANDPTF